MYRVGFPMWKSLAKRGVKLTLKVNVIYDPDARVFVADSPDLRGLVCEADTLDRLLPELRSSIRELISFELDKDLKKEPFAEIRFCY